MTVRELFTKIRDEVRIGELQPARAAVLASQLSALLGNISEEILEADVAFNVVYARELDKEGTANRAKIRAELTGEYRRKRQAHDMHLVAVEMIRSLRKLQDTYRDEMRLTR